MTKLPDGSFFDEAEYLRLNPDVAIAVKEGQWPSAYMHFAVAGRRDGRGYQAPVDEPWYVERYHAVAEDIAQGLAKSPSDHYRRVGAFRGYLPNAEALPKPATLNGSLWGGLWLDARDAEDAIDARLELGGITDAEASVARRWARAGWLIVRETFFSHEPSVSLLERDRVVALAQLIHAAPVQEKRVCTLGPSIDPPWIQASAIFAFSSHRNFALLVSSSEEFTHVEIAESGHLLAEPLHLGRFRSLAELKIRGLSEALPACKAEHQSRLDAQIFAADLKVRHLEITPEETLLLHADTPFKLPLGGRAARLAVVSTTPNELMAYDVQDHHD